MNDRFRTRIKPKYLVRSPAAWVTFIIPTIGRPTLARAIQSLHTQTQQLWEAIVCFDNCEPTITPTDKIKIMQYTDKQIGHHAGLVRNLAISQATTQWVAMLDDDDAVDPHYVEILEKRKRAYDIVIFRMQYKSGKILPSTTNLDDAIRCGRVGISFAARRYNIVKFVKCYEDDYVFLRDSRLQNLRIKILDEVGYYVRPG